MELGFLWTECLIARPEPYSLPGTATALSYVVLLVFFVACLISFFLGRRRRRLGELFSSSPCRFTIEI